MKKLAMLCLALTTLTTACGGDDPVEIAEAASAPERIISLSPTATESLFAIGAGSQVVATDPFSNHPPEAPESDLDGFNPNLEAIADLEPDLVVISFDPGDVVAGLDALGIATLVQDAATTIDDAYAQIEELGVVTGHRADAAALVAEMRSDIDRLVADAPSGDGLTYFHELDNTLYTLTGATFAGEIYGLFGLTNVADPADADGSAFGYPQISEEFLVDADPDLIFLADTICCGQSASSVAERPGWEQLGAVRDGHVIEMNDDVASRWGPRIVEFAEAIAMALDGVAPGE